MNKISEQCIVDGELTPALIRRKQELDHKMNAELAAIEANRGNMWVPKERLYAEVRQKYEMLWEQELAAAGYMLRPMFESIEQPEFIDWYNKLNVLQEATYTKPISFEAAQDLLKTSVAGVAPELIAEYTQVVGISPVEGVYLTDAGTAPRTSVLEPSVSRYNIYIKGWDRYYPNVELPRLYNRAAIMKLIIDGLTKAIQHTTLKKATANLKSIDIFKIDKYATVVVLGQSGAIYELSGNYFGDIRVKVNDSDFGPATLLSEPFEVIYTRSRQDNNNHSTHRDTISFTYYSWNSAYAGKLAKYLPADFSRTDGYMGSYSETRQITNPNSRNYSQADGIDSWAVTESVQVATD